MSSSSDSDEIEIDGFPPEIASNTRFTSIKSESTDSITNPTTKIFRPISVWNDDNNPTNVIRDCMNILKDSSKLSDTVKKQIMKHLELELSHRECPNQDNEWHFRSIYNCSNSQSIKQESNKPSIRINIEIPSANSNNINNVRYNVDKPVYDSGMQCWKTGMDFILQNDYGTGAIFESQNEVYQDTKETQTEKESDESDFNMALHSLTTSLRCRSEENLRVPEESGFDFLEIRLNNEIDFNVLKKIETAFEDSLKNLTDKNQIANITVAYKNFENIIRNNLEKYSRTVKKLKEDCQPILNNSYHKLTENQFKRFSKNQLFLSEIEEQINTLNNRLNITNEDLRGKVKSIKNKKIPKIQVIKKCNFVESLKLILQMVTNVKFQMSILNKELNVIS